MRILKTNSLGVSKLVNDFVDCIVVTLSLHIPVCVKVSAIELLSMTRPTDMDGYYHCFQRYSFAEV